MYVHVCAVTGLIVVISIIRIKALRRFPDWNTCFGVNEPAGASTDFVALAVALTDCIAIAFNFANILCLNNTGLAFVFVALTDFDVEVVSP